MRGRKRIRKKYRKPETPPLQCVLTIEGLNTVLQQMGKVIQALSQACIAAGPVVREQVWNVNNAFRIRER